MGSDWFQYMFGTALVAALHFCKVCSSDLVIGVMLNSSGKATDQANQSVISI